MKFDEFKKWIENQQLPQDELIARLYKAETSLEQIKLVSSAGKLDRHQLTEMFKGLIQQYGAGDSLRTVVNNIVDTFELELVKAVAENTDDNHCGGYGCMCGTD